MYTPPFSPSPTGSEAYLDPELLDYAQKRLEEEEAKADTVAPQQKADTVARRLFFDELSPPSFPQLSPTPASSPSRFVPLSTPGSTPESKKRKRALEILSAFSTYTPTSTRFPIAQPVTPGWALKKPIDERNIFPGTQLKTINDLNPINLEAPFSIDVVYQDQKGFYHNLFKQPEGSKSCFAYSLAMLLSDLMRSGKSLELDTEFWQWFQSAYLLKEENVQNQASRIGVKLESTRIPKKEPLAHIREQIKKSGFPVLTSITHPIFSSHEIVVDSVTDTHTTIRDPYSGKAWKVPNEKMKLLYQDIAPEKCLSIKQP